MMSQEKKIQQIEQLIKDASACLLQIKEYDKENKKLDILMDSYLQYQKQQPLFNNDYTFEADTLEEKSDNILSITPYAYSLVFDLKKPMNKNFSGYGYSSSYSSRDYDYYKRVEAYEENVKKLRKLMVEWLDSFEKFIHLNYTIEIESRDKKVISTTNEYSKIFFIKELNYALVYKMDFRDFATDILLQKRNEPSVVKQFDKHLLNSYLEKTQLESIMNEQNDAQIKPRKTVKI